MQGYEPEKRDKMMKFPLTFTVEEIHGHKGDFSDECDKCLAYYKDYIVETKGKESSN